MEHRPDPAARIELLTRRERLISLRSAGGTDAELHRLLHEVDAALARHDRGTYGLCET
jgi:RNA polymerase-binding transcription factor DksA